MCTEATKNEPAESAKRRDANGPVLPTRNDGRRKIVIQPALQKELEKAQLTKIDWFNHFDECCTKGHLPVDPNFVTIFRRIVMDIEAKAAAKTADRLRERSVEAEKDENEENK